MFYYAILDDDAAVTSVTSKSSAITDDHHIEISESQYNDPSSVKGKTYNYYTGEFVDRVYWACNTGEVHDSNTALGLALRDRLTMIEDLGIKTCGPAFTRITSRTLGSSIVVFSSKIDPPEKDGTYLVSLKYSSSSSLIDQSLFVVYIDKSKVLQSSINIVKCVSSSDSIDMLYSNGKLTCSITYNSANSNITAVDVRFI